MAVPTFPGTVPQVHYVLITLYTGSLPSPFLGFYAELAPSAVKLKFFLDAIFLNIG
jgi:hypothetical protein